MADANTKKVRAILAGAGAAVALGVAAWASTEPSAPLAVTSPSHTSAAAAPHAEQRYHVPVSLSQPKRGPDDALVTIVEWCDFHTPQCKSVEGVLDEVLKAHPTQVRLAFRHFADPTSMPALEEHEFTRMAFEMAGKFFEAKTLLMQAPGVGTRADLERYAAELGMDWATVQKRLDNHDYAAAVVADRTFAGMFEVTRVPALFVNGRSLGDVTTARLNELVDAELASAQQLLASGIARDKIYAEAIKDGVWKKPALARK